MKYHPDRFANASETEKKEAEEKFKRDKRAYQVLATSDQDKRAKYDRFGHAAFENGGEGGYGGGFEGFSGSGFEDISHLLRWKWIWWRCSTNRTRTWVRI